MALEFAPLSVAFFNCISKHLSSCGCLKLFLACRTANEICRLFFAAAVAVSFFVAIHSCTSEGCTCIKVYVQRGWCPPMTTRATNRRQEQDEGSGSKAVRVSGYITKSNQSNMKYWQPQ